MSGIQGAFQSFRSFAPPPEPPPPNTAAWFGGGYTYNGSYYWSISTVQRITFATDTAASSVRGPLSSTATQLAAAGNTTDGWFGGGRRISVPAPTGARSTVDRITYATDTATASVRGPLSSTRYNLAAVGNDIDAWFGGGQVRSTVDRITYASDTATASVRGPLSLARGKLAAAGNTTDGWFGGGYTPAVRSTVDRITYATDTATASVRGPLSLARQSLAAAGNTTDGWFAGGLGLSSVDRIIYATDTATAVARGPLNAVRYGIGAAGNTTDGWFGGGRPSAVSADLSTVSRISYATDTATASVRGPLSAQAVRLAAAGGIQ